jgi:type II secretory ATPase GspE/PulE/Tfp pilus assembly ATPase PilB-like protein
MTPKSHSARLLPTAARDRTELMAALEAHSHRPQQRQGGSWLNMQSGHVAVDAAQYPMEPMALQRVSMATLRRLNALPLTLHDGELFVALADPKRQADLDELAWASECRVRPLLADGEVIAQRLIGLASAQEKVGPAARASAAVARADRWLAGAQPQGTDEDTSQEAPPDSENSNALVKLINDTIIDAHTQGVSDIHVETQAGREPVRIRFRRDGRLGLYLELPHTLRSALVARIKIMASLDISERRRPQDGKINFSRHSAVHPLELRVVTLPTTQGLEDVVLRLLSRAEPLPLAQLDLQPALLARLKTAVERPHGLILCAGPTGSGKTTTLHSALAHINTADRKIWTAEDPVEITQPGLRQVQINPRIDWTFEKALRSFLRADPDVIMVGEVRDRETARVAVEAALTGHLVLSTIHTNSAPETITRLLDMGMDPFNFGDSLLAVLGQRLVRRLCTACRHSRPASRQELDELLADYLHAGHRGRGTQEAQLLADWTSRLAQQGTLKTWHAHGCSHCDGTGLRGRVGLHELLMVTREIRRLIHTRQPISQIQACALEQGMLTLRQDGIEKVLQGLTTLAEVRATVND